MRYTFTTVDEHEAARLLAAPDLCHVLSELSATLRSADKHGPPVEAGKTVESAVEWMRGQLYQLMGDNNIDLDRLWN